MNKTNYYCVAICKTVIKKDVFATKEEALVRFEEQFGEEILAELQEEEQRLMKSYIRYENRLSNLLVENGKGRVSAIEKEQREREKERLILLIEKKEAELRKLRQEMEDTHCYYMRKYDEYKDCSAEESERKMLRVGGVYKETEGRFSVKDVMYKVVSCVVQGVSDSSEVFQKVSIVMPKDRECTVCVPEQRKDNALKYISKERLRIIHENSKDERKVAA